MRRGPLEGLGASLDLVRRLVEDDPEVLDMLDREVKRDVGRPKREETVSNAHGFEPRPSSDSVQQALRRLRDARPDLHAKVLAGALTPHAAMVAAGSRRRKYRDSTVASKIISEEYIKRFDEVIPQGTLPGGTLQIQKHQYVVPLR